MAKWKQNGNDRHKPGYAPIEENENTKIKKRIKN